MDITLQDVIQKGDLKVSDPIIFPMKRSQLAKDLFNVVDKVRDGEASFSTRGKLVWMVIFEEPLHNQKRFNTFVENKKKIRELLDEEFSMKEGDLRAVFSAVRDKKNKLIRDKNGTFSWKFEGIYKFTGTDKPTAAEQHGMPANCMNCYEWVSDDLILKDWQAI
jgi:hypothetical protein